MSKADYALSLALHILLLITVALLSSYTPRVSTNVEDVINISLRPFAPAPQTIQPPEQVAERPSIPQAVEADDEIAYLPEARTIKDEKEVQPKPKEEPKEEKPETYQPEAVSGPETVAGVATDSTTDVSENLAGSRFGGMAVDNASFDYPYWFDVAVMKIERNWRNPVYYSEPLECTIYFQVISSGRVIKVEIEQSSGVSAYDKACKRAVERSRPLPPLPPEYAEEILGVHLIFPYRPG
jgi:TonB family protein